MLEAKLDEVSNKANGISLVKDSFSEEKKSERLPRRRFKMLKKTIL